MLSECKFFINLALITVHIVLIHCYSILGFARPSTVAAIVLLVGSFARTQDAVNFLTAGIGEKVVTPAVELPANTQTFDFGNRLIEFQAFLDGKEGTFILDTGAPQVLINNRGGSESRTLPKGLAAGGTVDLSDRLINTFELFGQTHRRLWALSLDLRPVELRLECTVDGFVGHSLLSEGELRIDYGATTFQLLPSVRRPKHQGASPLRTLKLEMVGHLPVVVLKVGAKKTLRFVLDTGSSVNLLDKRHEALTLPTDSKINVQGLDGQPVICDRVLIDQTEVSVREPKHPHLIDSTDNFVLFDFEHLHQASSAGSIDGILGSAFLSAYTVGIDYSRRKVYLWPKQ